jgi:hypothetical protein
MRWYFLTMIAIAAMVVGLAGFRGTRSANRPLEFLNDMDNQAKINGIHDAPNHCTVRWIPGVWFRTG